MRAERTHTRAVVLFQRAAPTSLLVQASRCLLPPPKAALRFHKSALFVSMTRSAGDDGQAPQKEVGNALARMGSALAARGQCHFRRW